MKIFEDFWGAAVPAQLLVKRGYGSCLLIDYERESNKPSMMLDRCRWVITSGERLVFYDYDISDIDDLRSLAPFRLISMAEFSDRIVMDFGNAQLLLFWTLESQEFSHAGIRKGSQEWQNMPQDDRDNITVFPVSGEPFGIEFEALLDPKDYPWGEEFLRREAELPDNAPVA
ncbi:hypothetical protein [Agrobacterium vitis]|uniref:hypothetical protein n=1 Tax=Agrobacterium vitis TaxID=373 RepID=UPI003D2D89BC